MPQRFTYNARTGELRGITTLKIGDPQVTVEEFVTSYISNNKNEVYDSDLVVATVLKNLDIAALTSGGGSGAGVTDSDLAVVAKLRSDADSDSVAIQALSTYIDSQIQIVNNSIDSKFDSEYLRVNNRFTNVDAQLSTINQRLDSDDATFSAVKSRVFGLVKDNDSDHNKELNLIQSDADSDEANLAGFKRFTLGQNASGPNNNLHEYYSSTGGYGSNPFHDSDLVIASAQKGINTTATYDSDRVIQTISVAGGTVLKDDFVDSDEVFNMGGEHGWFYDSDRVMDTVDKNFVTIINFVNNNLGKVDSEFVLTMVDSEEVVNMFREHNLVTKDLLDSETARIQLLLSNADSDQIAIAELRRDADSDTLVIQALKTQADVDSAYITLIRNDLDSDSSGLQAVRTDMDSESARINTRLSSIDSNVNTVQSTQTVQNSRLSTLEARSDSDEIKLQSIQEQVNQLRLEQDSDSANSGGSGGSGGVGITDSDLKVVADLRNDLDSDFDNFNTRIKSNFDSIQTLNSTTNSQGGRIAVLEAYQDSESTKVQALQASVDTNTATLNAYGGRITTLETRADSFKADIDSETARIQLLLASTDSDALSLAETRRDAESDAAVIVVIKQNAESDSAAIQALQSTIAPRLDSDEIAISKLRSDLDSESGEIRSLRADTDSDSQKIQTMSGQIGALEAGTFDDSQLVARLDSDQTAISALRRDVDSDSIKLQALEETVAGVNAVEVFTVTLDSDVSSIGSPSMGDVAFVPYRNVSGRGIQDTSVTIAGGILYAGGTYQFAGNAANKGDLEVGDVMIAQTNTAAGDQAWVVTSLGNNADEIIVAALDSDQILEVWVNDLRTNHTTVPITPSVSGTNDPMRASPAPKFYSGWTSVSNVPGSNPAVTTGVTLSGSSGGITHYMPKAYIHDSDGFDIELIVEGTDAYPEHKVMRRQDVFDSDQIVAIINENTGASLTDSDLKAIADLRNDVDSDSIAISARLPLAGGTMLGDIDGNGNKVLFANVYSNLVDLPSAATYHGMFAHVHATGAAYFAHAGNWIRLASYSDLTNDSDLSVVATLRNDVDSDSVAIQALSTRIDSVMSSLDSETARIQLLLASTDSDALNLAETRRDAESDAAAIVVIKQNAESDSAAIQALQSTLGPRLDSDELKIQALDTELSSLQTSLTARLDSDETAIQSVRTDMDVSFNVVNSGASAYTFTGDGFPSGVNNPTLYLQRGQTYNFRVNASGHPFQIRLSSGGSAYSTGVTNNGAQVGLVKFVVPMDAPESLVYQCTIHGGMVGTIKIGKQGFDSDQIASMILENANPGMTDSDLAVVAKLRSDVDSDSLKLQALQETVNQLRIEQDSDSTHSSGTGGGGAAGFDSDQIVAIINENPTSSGTGMTDSDLKVVADLRNDLENLRGNGSVSKEVKFTTFKYKAVQGQTTFSGVDRNNQTLAYTVNRINVFINGVLINDSDDYTATNGTSVVLNLAADSDDVVVIQKHEALYDSEAIVAIMNANSVGMSDSDLKAVADLRNDLDSDRANKISISLTRFDYTATQGQTVFSGSDDNGNTLSYVSGKIQIFLNGVLMLDTTDYSATNGTSVTLASAADSDDKLSIIKYFGKDATVSDAINITRFTFKYTSDGGSTVGDSEISGRDTHNNLLLYTAGKIQVFSNGILLEDSDDYIATDGSTITLRAAPDSDDVVSIFKYLGTIQSGFDSEQVVAIINENVSSGLAGWTAPTDSEYQLVAGQQVILDTSAWPRSVILPSSATLGDEVRVLDGAGLAATYPITVNRNGHRIMGDSDNMTVNTDNAGFALVYFNATYGWRLKEN